MNLKTKCPICNSRVKKEVFHNKVWGGNKNDKFIRCLKCDTVFLYPLPNNSQLTKFYKNYPNYMKGRSIDQNWSNLKNTYDVLSKRDIPLRKSFVEKYFVKGNVCDVGCSVGFMLDYFKSNNIEAVGIEPSLLEYNFSVSNNNTVYKSFKELPNKKYSNVTSYFVIEHLIDPINFIKSCLNITKKNGRFIFEIPHRNDFLLKNMKNNSYKDFILQKMHVTYFSYESLEFMLKKINKKYKIEFGQKYGLDNHLMWATRNSNSGADFKFSKKLNNIYKKELIKQNMYDYFIVIIYN